MNEMTAGEAAGILENEIKNFDMKMPISAEECICRDTICFAASILRRVASGELAEVVHAKWIKKGTFSGGGETLAICSKCGYPMSWWTKPKHCPNCGALMDGKDDSHA